MKEIFSALDLETSYEIINETKLPSRFTVSDLAATSIGSVGCAVAGLLNDLGLNSVVSTIQVDQRLAALWFSQSIYPIGWELPPVWDSIAGDYQTKDGWIKLHTNLAHHREAALSVLNCRADRESVARAVSSWSANELETAIVKSGGVAAMMRSQAAWQNHPQGVAISREPLVTFDESRYGQIKDWQATQARPLRGLRVLDLTRVLAGPVCTRALAGFGASVLRIDPPGWDEANVVPDITLGKRCANLQLNDPIDRDTFESLLAQADLLVHGYRHGALDKLGYGSAARQKISPNLLEVSLNAYGLTGPWAERRGFDSLVQMSCGIADTGMSCAGKTRPTPLPVQALDHATGYLMAASALQLVRSAVTNRRITSAHLSLARTAELLMAYPQDSKEELHSEVSTQDFSEIVEHTPWGNAHRLKPALAIYGTPMKWGLAASNLGSHKASW